MHATSLSEEGVISGMFDEFQRRSVDVEIDITRKEGCPFLGWVTQASLMKIEERPVVGTKTD